jgi:hypothetical protein
MPAAVVSARATTTAVPAPPTVPGPCRGPSPAGNPGTPQEQRVRPRSAAAVADRQRLSWTTRSQSERAPGPPSCPPWHPGPHDTPPTQSRRVWRSSAFAPVRAKPTGRPPSVQTRCRRSPQRPGPAGTWPLPHQSAPSAEAQRGAGQRRGIPCARLGGLATAGLAGLTTNPPPIRRHGNKRGSNDSHHVRSPSRLRSSEGALMPRGPRSRFTGGATPRSWRTPR